MKNIFIITLFLILTISNKSYSQVTVENATDKTVTICVAWIDIHESSSKVYIETWSEGWWSIEPGQKSTIKSVCPVDDYIFYYAYSNDKVWEGSSTEYGNGIPDYFRISSIAFKIKNPSYDKSVTYPANYWKIFRKKKVDKGGVFKSSNVSIYLT